MKSTAASIQILSWEQAQAWAYPVRLEVFVKEQGVPKELELDEDDPLAWHAVAELDTLIIGTARLKKWQDWSNGSDASIPPPWCS
jgi:predicted GNAT family N-acyltransferase